MDTVCVAGNQYRLAGTDTDADPRFKELSGFLAEWIEQNSEAVNRQFSYAVQETAKMDLGKDEIVQVFMFEMIRHGLSYVVSAEKENTTRRQAEGIKAAKEQGVHFGRQKIEKPADFYTLYFRYKKGEISSRMCGEKLNVSHSTFLKWIKEVDQTM